MLLTVAFTATDGLGLFFLPIGLWKMGFPETVSALTSFYYSEVKFTAEPLVDLLNGMGTLLQ